MKIRRLKLSGFKSFVDAAELRIEPGLTGVVGPNGCGKSNLLEAIRWVMGEASAKSMRGGGMEDVIFAGTTSRPARDFAEVSLLIEQGGAHTPGLPGSGVLHDGEVEVVRRIERGAGSAYRLNGRDVRAKDVSLLFADAATGAHSPALVSQGKIAAVIAAKPAERRQMLEEAAGISGLHVRRKDAEQKLRATEGNLTRLDEVLAEMEQRANALKRQARTAERYRVLSEEVRLFEARLIFAKWRDAVAAAEAARKEASAAEAAVTAAQTKQDEARVAQEQAVATLAQARAAAQKARDAANDISQQLASNRQELGQTERRLRELQERREALLQDQGREDALGHDAAEALARLEEEDKSLAMTMAQSDKEQANREALVAHLSETSHAAELALARAQTEQASALADARVAEAALHTATQAVARTEQDCAAVAAEQQRLPDEAPLKAALQDAEARAGATGQIIMTASDAIAAAEQARDTAAKAREVAQAQVGERRAQLAALESEARALNKALESGDTADRAIGHVRADPGFEQALAAALGDELDAGLKTGNARYWGGAEPNTSDPALPVGAICLADKVQAPAALQRRLQQVGVIDQDDGTLILQVGQRMVTRDGRLRRWDGYIATGVGADAAARLMRINRLAALEQQMPDARAQLAAAEQAEQDAQQQVNRAREDERAAREALAKAEGEQRQALRDGDQARAAIDRLADQRRALDERATRAAAGRDAAKQQCTEAEAAKAALPDQQQINAQVADLRAQHDRARDQFGQARSELAGLQGRIGRDHARREAIRAEIRGWKSRAGDAAKRLREMQQRFEDITREQAEQQDRPARLALLITGLEAENDRAAALSIERAASEQEAETALRHAEQAASTAGEALAAARETRAGAAARLENQELRRVEMGRVAGERFECPAPVLPEKIGFAAIDVGDVGGESAKLERATLDRERLGPVNLVAEQELNELEQVREVSTRERDELHLAINRLRGSIGSLNREGRTRLLAAFEAVDGHFRRLFTTLFGGGEAHLELVDSDDPLEAGLEILAQPPGKRLASLTLLSGGEQALTAVALIFGLFLTNPAPICVLDEVDAPLDDANIERFCDLLDQMKQETETRYLIVTHNAVTMSRMDRLFGVTMVERGVSRLVSVDLERAEQLLAQ